jgi:hypothetical protein
VAHPAPIALFVYRRLQHTRQTVDALRANELAAESDLHIYSDAPKSADAAESVQAVREYIRTITGFRHVRIIEQPRNVGLAQSIISGVSEICQQAGRVIAVEDDLVTSESFLSYMNQALDLYEHDERVASIHGYCYPITRIELPRSFFLRGADCWGWGTWQRSWQHFEPDGRKLLAELRARGLEHAFDLDGSWPFTRMLKEQISGKNDSWAIRWHATCYLQDRLTLYPGRSLVDNIGNDASGTHGCATDVYSNQLARAAQRLERVPVVESQQARAAFADFLRGPSRSIFRRIVSRVFNRAGAPTGERA